MIGHHRISLLVGLFLCCCIHVSSERLSRDITWQIRVRGGDAEEAVEADAAEESNTAPEEAVEMPTTGDDDNDDKETEENAPAGAESDESTSAAEVEQEDAAELRLRGKELHDAGDFVEAAELFQKAADSIQNNSGDDASPSEDYVTCRLHQALCHLKSENYESCIDACSDVLGEETNPTTYSPAVRARAYHRRAKAKLALEDSSGALQDARSAAFLGDRRAVAFYGKLMRENSPFSGPEFPSLSDSSSSALLESMLGKSSASSSPGTGMPDFNPASLLMGNSDTGNILNALKPGGKGSGLAKSLMESLSKRLDDEATQAKISTYLQSANKQQLQQLVGMAGVSNVVQDSHLDKILSICHGVTPKTIKRTVKTSKRAVYGIKIVRRVTRIINKYKTFLIALMLLQWSKSATFRPLPTDRKAAKLAAKQAIKDAMKNSRTP